MKTTILYSLLFLTMLGVGIGCKKEVEPVEDLQSSVYPPGCQIAQVLYKTPINGRDISKLSGFEFVTPEGGGRIQVATISSTTNTYDSQKRITKEYGQYLGTIRMTLYTYGNTLIKYDSYTKSGSNFPYVEIRDTTQLNEQGYLVPRYGKSSTSSYTYNKDGQIIDRYSSNPDAHPVSTYENGNLIRDITEVGLSYNNGKYTAFEARAKTYKYDLTRPNMPVIYQYFGKASRNLPIEETAYAADLGGAVYRRTFTYTFDEWGRVKRRLAYGQRLNASWPFEDDPGGIGVLDYQYQGCP